MTAERFENWKRENAAETEQETINGVDYYFCTLPTGWIGVFKRENTGEYTPIIQAADINHAKHYCNMLEPISVPFNVI